MAATAVVELEAEAAQENVMAAVKVALVVPAATEEMAAVATTAEMGLAMAPATTVKVRLMGRPAMVP